jgi:hypothetical protein
MGSMLGFIIMQIGRFVSRNESHSSPAIFVTAILVIMSLAPAQVSAQTGPGDVFESGGGNSSAPGDVFESGGNNSGRTGTQSGVRGNPNCPPPVIGGITPKNWSCPTGKQAVDDLPCAPGAPGAFNVNETLNNINQYWGRMFSAQGLGYPPLNVGLTSEDDWGYNSSTHQLDYNRDAFVQAMQQSAAGGMLTFSETIAIAHEVAHYVQYYGGRNFTTGLQSELDADRLAGAYLRWADSNHLLGRCDVARALMQNFNARDPAGVPPFDPDAHGSGAERANALLDGYLNGPGAFVNRSPSSYNAPWRNAPAPEPSSGF